MSIEDAQMIDCFVESLEEYIEAKKGRNKCYAETEDYAGYYCYHHDSRVADAAKDIRKYLIACIKETFEGE